MENYELLTKEQINILLKCYYLKKYTRVAETESLTTAKVKRIKENALRSIRLAYSKSHIQGIRFDGKTVLQHMAERCGMTENNLSKVFDKYIAEGLTSQEKRYWERIRKAGNVPTAAELLDFIYDKFEVDIEGGI
ncbi:hypothetical protein MKD05_10690 [[Clostridium] innocuum]|nr:hypothetical protein [[Clostridium] innocuum]